MAGKWSGLSLGGNVFSIYPASMADYCDNLISTGHTYIRALLMDYTNTAYIDYCHASILIANAKGLKCIWGLSSNPTVLTSATWQAYRDAVVTQAQWAQANGVYEFQIGNEEEFHIDGTISDATLKASLKTLATDVKAVYTIGNVSYTANCANLDQWRSSGRGSIDIIGINLYKGGNGVFNWNWKKSVTDMFNTFGADHTYITEFGPSYTSLADYSPSESAQASATKEMLDYIIASGMTRAIYFCYKDADFGAINADGTYREVYWTLLGQRKTVTGRSAVSRTVAGSRSIANRNSI